MRTRLACLNCLFPAGNPFQDVHSVLKLFEGLNIDKVCGRPTMLGD